MKTKFDYALLEHRANNFNVAKNLYLEILSEDANNTEILHLLGILSAQDKDFEGAKSYLNKALAINSNSAALNNSMGNVLKNLENYVEAIDYYQKAIAINKDYAVAYNNLGNVYVKLSQLENAILEYQKAIVLNSEYADAYYNVSLIFIKLNRFDEAINNLQMTLKLTPRHFEAHCCLGRLLYQQNKLDKAILHLQKALRIDKNSPEAHNNLGVFLLAKDKINHAIKHFNKALILDPVSIEAFNNLGAIFLMQNNLEVALKYFLRLSQLDKDFEVFYNLGVIYMDINRPHDAIEYFTESLHFKANNYATHINLGAIYLKLGDYTNARKHYEFCLSLQPDNQEIKYILDAILQKKFPNKAPDEYVKNLFDQYSNIFEKHLAALNYKAPELLFNTVSAAINIQEKKFNILDLGCGTGLCGKLFYPYSKKLIGIDLSPKMIEIAKQKNIYNELIVANIEKALLSFENIDIILAADTLVYLGDLSTVFNAVKKVLLVNGIFALTLEKSDKYPFVLQQSARFAHSEKYIKDLVAQNGFAILSYKNVVVRNQRNLPVESCLFLLRKIQLDD